VQACIATIDAASDRAAPTPSAVQAECWGALLAAAHHPVARGDDIDDDDGGGGGGGDDDANGPASVDVEEMMMRQRRSDAILSCDLIANSYTGSGKTLAFLLPLCAELSLVRADSCSDDGAGDSSAESLARPVALVLAPTRELCQQIGVVAQQIAHHDGMRVCPRFVATCPRCGLRSCWKVRCGRL
jgi:hypothetical protein